MRFPSGDSKTTEQKSPVARDMCSATIPSRASMSGTASLNASTAAPIAPRRPGSSAWVPRRGSDPSIDTVQLYSGVVAKCLLYRPNRVQAPRVGAISVLDTTSALDPMVEGIHLTSATTSEGGTSELVRWLEGHRIRPSNR